MSSPVEFVALPPERYRSSQASAQAGGCCCCCCCCLHSLGGIVGAAVALKLGGGPAYRNDAAAEEFDDGFDQPRLIAPRTTLPEEEGEGATARSLFWYSFLFLMLLIGVVGTVVWRTPLAGGFAVLMVMPVLQLVSAGIALFALAFSSRPDRGYQLRCLGRLTLGTIAGSLLGLFVMLAAIVALDG